MSIADPTFDKRLEAAYQSAMSRVLWKEHLRGHQSQEYWAEGVQSWFDDNRQNDAQHNHVHTRAKLREYDPALAALCLEVLGDKPWRYLRPGRRIAADRSHLTGWDPAHLPKFLWRRCAPIPDKPRVTIDTYGGLNSRRTRTTRPRRAPSKISSPT